MKKLMASAMIALMMLALSAPVALAKDTDREDRQEDRQERAEDNGFFFGENGFFVQGDRFDEDRFDEDRFDDDFDGFDFDGFDFDGFDFDGFDFDFDGSGFGQDFEQETESGDVDQSFEISGGGDNASQCVNVSGVSNTGNVQDVSGFVSFDSDIDEFEQEDIGSELTVDGSSEVTCDQSVNQAAAAG